MENIIKQKREEQGYSQSQFAELADINFRTLQDYEQGRKPISSIKGEVLYRISRGLGCSMEDLMLEAGATKEQDAQTMRLSIYGQKLDELLNKHHGRKHSAIFDDIFKTMSIDCTNLMIPLINLAFDEHYSLDTKIINLSQEHMAAPDRGKFIKRISDANILLVEKSGVEKRFQIECQSRTDNAILFRLYEYASLSALEEAELEGNVLKVKMPKSALIYLRSGDSTPAEMTIVLDTPGGEVSWSVPVISSKSFGINELFEKKLYFLIPFYLLNYENDLPYYEHKKEMREELKREIAEILDRLEMAVDDGEVDSYQWVTIRNLSKKLCEYLTSDYKRVGEEAMDVMGGKVLEYEAKDILRRGQAEGKMEGIVLVVNKLMENMSVTLEEAVKMIGFTMEDYNKFVASSKS